jgi:hypothetical protein
MRNQRYQPGIQNGPVARRRTRSKNTATSKARGLNAGATKTSSRLHSNRASYRLTNRPSHRRRDEGGGSSVMWMMILIGAALSAVFIFALRSQINTHKIAQAEEQLKVKLDEYASRQKFLALDQQRALNFSESDRAGRRNGLDRLKLDGESAPPSVIVNQITPPLRAPQTDHKAAKVVKVVKSSAAKSSKARVVKAPIVKVKKQSNKRRQASRSRPRR